MTKLIGDHVTDGMSDKFGPISFGRQDGQESFTKPYSEKTGEQLDETVRALINEAHRRTTELLTEKKEQLEKVALRLLEKEVLSRQDMVDLLGPRPFDGPDAYDDAMGASGRGPKGPPPAGGGGTPNQPLPKKETDPHPLGALLSFRCLMDFAR